MVNCNKSCKNNHHIPRLEWILLNIKGRMISPQILIKFNSYSLLICLAGFWWVHVVGSFWSHFTVVHITSLNQINSSKSFHKKCHLKKYIFVISEFFLLDFFRKWKSFVGFSKKIKIFCWIFPKMRLKDSLLRLERTNAVSQDNLYCSKIVILTWEV